METRVERSKRKSKIRWIGRLKFLLVIFLFFVTVTGIYLVNKEAREFEVFENPVIVNYDGSRKILTLFGKDYYIDLKIIKKQF